MSSTLISQVETSNESKSKLQETVVELATVFSMWAVSAVVIVMLGLQWVA